MRKIHFLLALLFLCFVIHVLCFMTTLGFFMAVLATIAVYLVAGFMILVMIKLLDLLPN